MRSASLLALLPTLLLTTCSPSPETAQAQQTSSKPATRPLNAGANRYAWLAEPYRVESSLAARFAAPGGTQRVPLTEGSFGHWLRYLPLRPAGTPVRLHTGQLKPNQDVHAAVLNLDTGKRDLQQCADAVIRVRSEYQFTQNFRSIHYQLTSGHDIWFGDWVEGKTFEVLGDDVLPATKAAEEPSHAALRRYLDLIFTYAGTLSLSRELQPVPFSDIQPGDVFIKGGSPGHAVLVLDMAVRPTTGRRYVLLAQSYMPAQDMHVLRNVQDSRLGAWFEVSPTAEWLETPEWPFGSDQLKRWQ